MYGKKREVYGIIKKVHGNKSETRRNPYQVCGNPAGGQRGNRAILKMVIEKDEVYGNNGDLHRKRGEVYGIIKEVRGNKSKTHGISDQIPGNRNMRHSITEEGTLKKFFKNK
ncbi:hypothetical protein [Neobacillus vireti]|uniref:hypothetical protein n=1 Tax=Neobacillus vireti TaxID=220686 RepID=UPI002FFFBEF0